MSINLHEKYDKWLCEWKDKLHEKCDFNGNLKDEEIFSIFYQEHICNMGSYIAIIGDLAYQIQEIQKDIQKIHGELDELYQ